MFGMLLAFTLNHAIQAIKPFMADIPPKFLEAGPSATRTVAKVDGVEIKAKDVEDLLWQWRGYEAVEELVGYQVIKAEAEKRGITVTAAEVEAKVPEQMIAFADQTQGDSEEALLRLGFTRSRAYIRVRHDLLLEKMAAAEFHEADFVKVSAITFKPDAQMTLEQCLTAADAAYAKLQKGEKWSSVLATTTSVPQVLEQEGSLGWKPRRLFPESVLKEFSALKAGAFIKPAQTTAGVQIFRLDARGDQIPSEQVRELRSVYLAGKGPQIEKELRAKAKIETYKPAKKT